LERELKLGAPAGFRLPDLTGIGRGLEVAAPERRRHTATYWDTRDLRLMRWDCGLRYRSSDGWTAKLPAAGEGDVLVRRELRFGGPPQRPPDDALDLLLGMTRREPLQPVVELHTARERVAIRDAAGSELAELTNDLVAVMRGDRVTRRFREVELEFSAGFPADVLTEIEWRLRRAGAGRPHRVAKHVAALGLAAGIDPEIALPELGPRSTALQVVRRTFAQGVLELVRHDPGVRLDDDVEDLHLMRVSTRRLRSGLKTFEGLLEPAWTAALRAELRWLGGLLGPVRDADVLALRLGGAASSLPLAEREAAKDLLAHLEEQRRGHRADLMRGLRSPRYVGLLEGLVQAAREPLWRVAPELPGRHVTGALVAARWKRLRRSVAALGSRAEDAELHAVRVRAKHLRYAAEAVAPLVGKPARRLAKAARGVQRTLGDRQDAVVAAEWLRGAASRVPRQAAFVAGVLAERERHELA
jgi:CHAD domain-containing protein